MYYVSRLAANALQVFRTYVQSMNASVRRQSQSAQQPFDFKHISYLSRLDDFDELGPCVVMASPGFMQSGLSRRLFEHWCVWF